MTTTTTSSECAYDKVIKRQRRTSSQSTEEEYKYHIVNIHTWLRGFDDEDDYNLHETDNEIKHGSRRRSLLPIVDLRSIEDYNERHLEPNVISCVSAQNSTTPSDDDDDFLANPASTVCHNEVDDENSNRGGIITVNLPLASLLSGERSCELPPRNLAFAILIPRGYAQTFMDESHAGCGGGGGDGEKHCIIHQLFFATHSAATRQSRKPWKVRQVLLDTDTLWKEAEDIEGLVVARCGSATNRKGGGGDRSRSPFRCLPRLWRPDPLISSYVLPFLMNWTMHYSNNHVTVFDSRINDGKAEDHDKCNTCRAKTLGLVWDLGCGSGRDICYLAEESKEFRERCTDTSTRELHFIGVDNHRGSAARCTPLWKNRGVDEISESICLDLNKLHLVREYLMDPTKVLHLPLHDAACHADIVCIYSIRYLNRKLLSYIANTRTVEESVVMPDSQSSTSGTHSPPSSHLVLPLGTLIAISHFCKPHEGASWKFDHPKESSVLDRWELRNLFTGSSNTDCERKFDSQRWEILIDDVIVDGDHGRTLTQFVAKKIA